MTSSPHQGGVTTKLARFLALAAAPLTLTAVACSSSGGSTPSAAPAPTSAAPVTTTPPAATPAACAVTENATAKPPSNVPTPTDAVFYEKVAQGSTTQYF